MVKKFLRYMVAFGLTTCVTVGGLSSSKAYGDLIPISCETGCSLQYLMDNDLTIQVGDKLFSDFFGSSTAYHATAVPLDSVIVTPRIIADGAFGHTEYGLSFQLPYDNTVYAGQGKDLVVSFEVATLSGLDLIIDDYLSMTGSAVNNSVAKIAEVIEDENNQFINTLNTWSDPLRIPPVQLTDAYLFDTTPQNILKIRKDVNWFGRACATSAPCDNSAWISDFTQMFSQLPPDRDIPEPASMLLLGFGLAGLGIARRKRPTK